MKSAADLVGIPISAGRSLSTRISKPLHVSVDARDPVPECFRVGPLVVVNSYLVEVLRQYSGESETFEVKIEHGRKALDEKFWFLNVLSGCDCIDWEGSAFKEVGGGFRGTFRKLVLKDSCYCSFDYFRFAWTIPFLVGVKEELAEAILKMNFSGVKLIFPKDFRSPDAI